MAYDVGAVLIRAARRGGWTEQATNSLDYYTHNFIRPETGGRNSVVRVRVTNRIVDAQVNVCGIRRSFTIPTPQKIESILSSPPPAPVHHRQPVPDDFVESLDGAVSAWRSKPPSDLADAIRGGDRLATAAEEILRDLKGRKE
jgi:hypothetical protein